MTFDEWIFKVCECIAHRTKKDVHDIYVSLNLTDAKLSFVDRVSAEDYAQQRLS